MKADIQPLLLNYGFMSVSRTCLMEKSLLRRINHLKSVRWCGSIGQKSKHPGKILGVHYFQL